MRISIDKKSWVDLPLFLLGILQIFLLTIGAFGASSGLNYIIHINIYIIIFCVIVSLVVKGIAKHYLAFSFFLCFFIFLMGQKLFSANKNVFSTFVLTELNDDDYFTFLLLLSFAIIITYYAYSYFMSQIKHSRKEEQLYNVQNLLPIVRLIFYVTLPFALYMQILIVVEKSLLSYTAGYLVNVNVPTIVRIANYIYSAITMVYLATKPSKKELYFVLGSFLLIEGGVQLIQGRRALFATTLLFFVWYLIKFYKVERIRKKYYLIGGLGILVIICLFFVVEQRRSGNQMNILSILDMIEKLMISTGASDSVIANTIQQKDAFPNSGVLYLIDPVLNNPITNILNGKMGIAQGREYIENFYSFSHHISYMTEPSLYLAGYGMGSSYLAEVYLAFGITGVGVISFLLGKVISVLENISLSNNVFTNSIYFILIKSLFALPRAGLFEFFSDLVYLFFVFVLIYPFYGRKKSRK